MSDIDLLAERGPLLDEPFARQLRAKLRELRCYLGARGDAVRLSYFIASRVPDGEMDLQVFCKSTQRVLAVPQETQRHCG